MQLRISAYFDENGKSNMGESMPVKITIKFFINQGKSGIPTKLSTSKEERLDWLESFK